jgi:uncharacterized protein YqjF (DUF2071 family)
MSKQDYDLAATASLPGLHLVGTVTRRFLISYPVPPETLAAAAPPGAELSVHGGAAWVSACFVNIVGMRPSPAPKWMGLEFNYLIHRTRARLPYPDGKLRESVLILEANIDRPLLGTLARWSTGVRFNVRDITLTEAQDSWELRMESAGETLYEAEIGKPSISTQLAPSSRFGSAGDADDFLLGVSYGADWQPGSGAIRLLAETHDPWDTLVGTCQTKRHAFLESRGFTAPEADHVITMTDIPHYFALRGIPVTCVDPQEECSGSREG